MKHSIIKLYKKTKKVLEKLINKNNKKHFSKNKINKK